jgi:hypothetical protein
LKDPWLAQKIVKLLVETGFPAQRLEVEITESSLFKNLSLAQSIVGSLKNQGIPDCIGRFRHWIQLTCSSARITVRSHQDRSQFCLDDAKIRKVRRS